MTLRDLFLAVSENPLPIYIYLICLPLFAFLWGILTQKEKPNSSLIYGFSILIFLAVIPGVFALLLAVYLFMFERQSVWDMNILIQILPIVMIVLTLKIIKKYVPFELIPGFDKISKFIAIITVIIITMWLLDKTHILVISFVPIYVIFLGIVIVYFLIRYLLSKTI